MAQSREIWESAAPGWARWEPTIAAWMGDATEVMLEMAGVDTGKRVLDIASGAGSQTLRAAQRVGRAGSVVASDIAETMLRHVQDSARAAALTNVVTLAGAAEKLELDADSFDAVICRLGLMLFASPAQALAAALHALKPRGRLAAVVFSSVEANPFMAKPMEILLRHAGKKPPGAGEPGIFSLGAPGLLARLLTQTGFVDVEERYLIAPLRLGSAAQALSMMREAFGAYRAVVSECSEPVRSAAWEDVARVLESFETDEGFVGKAEVLIAAGRKSAPAGVH